MYELFRHHDDDDLRHLLIKVLKNQEIAMAQYDDLVTALAQLQSDVNDLAARIATPPPPVVTDLTAPLASVAAIDTQVKGLDVPPPPPAPAPAA